MIDAWIIQHDELPALPAETRLLFFHRSIGGAAGSAVDGLGRFGVTGHGLGWGGMMGFAVLYPSYDYYDYGTGRGLKWLISDIHRKFQDAPIPQKYCCSCSKA